MVNIKEKSMAESWNGYDGQALLTSGHGGMEKVVGDLKLTFL